MVFIDDILIYSKSVNDHVNHLWIVFKVLNDNKLFVKLSTCEFWLTSVEFLCNIVSSEGVEVNLRKENTVKSSPKLLSPADIRRFLDLVRL